MEVTFASAEDEVEGDVLSIRDAGKRQPFKSLPMRAQFGIVSYLGTSWRGTTGDLAGTLAVRGKGARVFSPADQGVLLVVAGLLAPRWQEGAPAANGRARRPVSAGLPGCQGG